MAYEPTGIMSMYPVYLARLRGEGEAREVYETGIAQNETNLNQNFDALYQKLCEIEDYLANME